MNKKILLFGLVVLGVLMLSSMVSAYTANPYYGSYYGNRYNNYNSNYNYACGYGNCGNMPYPIAANYNYGNIRAGGFFGANSNYIVNLRPAYVSPPTCMNRPSMYSSGCNNRQAPFARAGGYYGYYPGSNYYYSSLRMPTYGGYGGYGTKYTNMNYMYTGVM